MKMGGWGEDKGPKQPRREVEFGVSGQVFLPKKSNPRAPQLPGALTHSRDSLRSNLLQPQVCTSPLQTGPCP